MCYICHVKSKWEHNTVSDNVIPLNNKAAAHREWQTLYDLLTEVDVQMDLRKWQEARKRLIAAAEYVDQRLKATE
jgi:hypothetical protein